MLKHAKDFIDCTMHASDGDVGPVRALYFDSGNCTVRYLSVSSGGTQRLVPVTALRARDYPEKRINVNLSKEQIRNSPDVGVNLPVSRDTEISIMSHYGLPLYGETEPALRQSEEVIIVPEERTAMVEGREAVIIMEPQGGVIVADKIPDARRLYGTDELFNFRVLATDGEIGKIDDFIVDDDTGEVRYLVIDTGKWLSGRKVLVSPMQIDSVSRGNGEVRLDLPKETIRTSPEYDPNRPLEPAYEKQLIQHYTGEAGGARYALWRFDFMRKAMRAGRKLRIITMSPAMVHWTSDNWRTSHDTRTMDTGTGIHIADLDTENLAQGNSIHFTFFWPEADHWEGKNFSVRVKHAAHARMREPAMAGRR